MPIHIDQRLARLARLEAHYSKQFRTALLRQIAPAIEAVRHGWTMELVVAMVLTKPLETAFYKILLPVVAQEAELEYKRLLAEDQTEQKAQKPIYKQPPRQQWQSAAQQYAQHEATKAIKDITNTTKKQVKQVLKESLATGRSTQETAKALEQASAKLSKTRSKVIARTELNAAQNRGSSVGAKSTGLKLNKVWLATSDARTRPSHVEASGQEVAMDDFFVVGDEAASAPGDPSLPARERANCRCSTTYKRKTTER